MNTHLNMKIHEQQIQTNDDAFQVYSNFCQVLSGSTLPLRTQASVTSPPVLGRERGREGMEGREGASEDERDESERREGRECGLREGGRRAPGREGKREGRERDSSSGEQYWER